MGDNAKQSIYEYICVIRNQPNEDNREETGIIVSIYPSHIKLSSLTLEQIFFPGSKVEGYFVTTLYDQNKLYHSHNYTMCSRNLSVFVVSLQHLVGVGALLQLVLSNHEIEPLSVAKEIADCLDTFTSDGSVSPREKEKEKEKEKDKKNNNNNNNNNNNKYKKIKVRASTRMLYKAAVFDFKRPPDDEAYHDVTAVPLMKYISPPNLLQLFSALLAERSIIFVSSNPAILSATILSLLSFLYPLKWVGILYPVLPKRLYLLLHCSIPYIVGCLPYTLVALGDPPEGTIIVNLDPPSLAPSSSPPPPSSAPTSSLLSSSSSPPPSSLSTTIPTPPLPLPFALFLLEGIRKHGNIYFSTRDRSNTMPLPDYITSFTPTAEEARLKQGFWAGIVESRLSLEKSWPWIACILDNPIALEPIFDTGEPGTIVPLDNGTQVPLDARNLRSYFTSVLATLIEPYPLVVSYDPQGLFDTSAFSAELPDTYFNFSIPLIQTRMFGKFLLEYLADKRVVRRTSFEKVLEYITTTRNSEICSREGVIYEGYFWKRGRGVKSWRYRYARIKDNELRYYEDKNRKLPLNPGDIVKPQNLAEKGHVIITHETIVRFPPVTEENRKDVTTNYPFYATVQKPSKKSRTLWMCASSSDERRSWAKFIRAIAAHSLPPSSPPPPLSSPLPSLDDAARVPTLQVLKENMDALQLKISKALEGAIKSRPFASAITYTDIPSM